MKTKTWKVRIKNIMDLESAKKLMNEAKIFRNNINHFARLRYFYFLNPENNNLYLDFAEELNLLDWVKEGGYNGNYNTFGNLVLKKTHNYNNFNLLNAKIEQNIIRDLASNWKGFFNKKKGDNWKDSKPPKTVRNDYITVTLNNQTLSKKALKNRIIKPTGFKYGIELPWFISENNIFSVKLKESNSKFYMLVIYKESEAEVIDLDRNRVMGIDLGIDILAAMTFNFQKRPILLRDKKLKEWNQWYNKETSRLKSLLPRNQFQSKRIENITEKRNLRIYHNLHKDANSILELCLRNNIGKIVVGKNNGWKQEVNIGKKNNQNFIQIPHSRFIEILKYKCADYKIELIIQEESYTSKASYLDKDIIPVYNPESKEKYKFSGYRIHRGLYKSKSGKVIHADINGSFNILRKNNIEINNTEINPISLK